MAIARVTVLDFADEESKKSNLHLYEQRWKEVFPNMHLNMIISTGPTSFLSISVYENDKEAEANMEARTKLHEDFIKVVKNSRGSKLKDPEKNNIFTGEFWTGKTSLKLGLIDGIGNADQVLKEKFGEKVIIKTFEKPKGFIARKLSSSVQDPVEKLVNLIEEKSMWQKFGL